MAISASETPDPLARDGGAAAVDSITLEAVVATVGGFPVLAGVDLRVAAGEVLLVSGRNGAGKTSLLRLLAGRVPLAAGRAIVLGHDLGADPRAHRRQIALVGQETFCYDDLSVLHNLRLHARAAGTGDIGVDEAVELMGLTPVIHVKHGQLSTGQRRRCALAVGLTRRSDLLLLDEPHAGLDAAGRDLLDGLIREAVDQHGATVLLASHERERTATLAHRRVTVAGGRINGGIKQSQAQAQAAPVAP